MTAFQKYIVIGYRWLAIAVLCTVLIGAGVFFSTMAVYQVNGTWGAPVILSQSSPRIMSINSEIFRARQAISLLRTTVEHNNRQLEVLGSSKTTQESVLERYSESLEKQSKVDAALTGKLSKLVGEKRGMDARAVEVAKATDVIDAAIDKELKAGLITAETAARSRAQAVTNASSVTSARVSTAALEQQVNELAAGVATYKGGDSSTRVLENVSRVEMMRANIADVVLRMAQLEADNAVKSKEIDEAERLLETLLRSPYVLAANSKDLDNQFAFVPYENEKAVAVGESVYSCALEFVICSKVGTVKTVTTDEERGRHPIFNRDVRGFLVELELTDKSAAKDRVLFFGHSPLYL